MFELSSYIPDIIAFVSGGGLMYFLNWSANKRKANAEAKSGELQNDETLINLLKTKDEVIAGKDDQINKLTAKLTFTLGIICKHGACPLREPERGRGFAWTENHEDEGEGTLVDAVPIQLIARKYGYRLTYNKNSFKEWREEPSEGTTEEGESNGD